jgi:hypothetical protein
MQDYLRTPRKVWGAQVVVIDVCSLFNTDSREKDGIIY